MDPMYFPIIVGIAAVVIVVILFHYLPFLILLWAQVSGVHI